LYHIIFFPRKNPFYQKKFEKIIFSSKFAPGIVIEFFVANLNYLFYIKKFLMLKK